MHTLQEHNGQNAVHRTVQRMFQYPEPTNVTGKTIADLEGEGEKAGQKTKIIVITGASAGIGRAAVRAFARPGACLGLIARDEAGLSKAQEEVTRSGGQALMFPI